MAVQVATLDILTDRAHFEPEVARAIGDAITTEMNHARETLATQAELRGLGSELRQEIAELRAEMRQEFAALRAEIKVAIAEAKTDIVRWMFTAMAAQTTLLVGAMYFMLTHLR
jgi:cell division septum initiation protein DivIVA